MRTVLSKEKFLIFPSNLQNNVPNNSHTRVQSVLQPATHYTVLNVKAVRCILAHLYLNIDQLFRKSDWHTLTVINLLLTLWHITVIHCVLNKDVFFLCLLTLLLIYPDVMKKKRTHTSIWLICMLWKVTIFFLSVWMAMIISDRIQPVSSRGLP